MSQNLCFYPFSSQLTQASSRLKQNKMMPTTNQSISNKITTVDQMVAKYQPESPVMCLRPHVIKRIAHRFVSVMGGRVFYAVKCNPDPQVLAALAKGGVTAFDTASIGEIRAVRAQFPKAEIGFFNPIKTRTTIAEAYYQHGVRCFSLDSHEELTRLIEATGAATDLILLLRLSLPKGPARFDLSGKFGISRADAPALLQACRIRSAKLGLSFHVGSQCLKPQAWQTAIALAGTVAQSAGVKLDILDIGGGFPVTYPGEEPVTLSVFVETITQARIQAGLGHTTLWSEPGRALVAAGGSVVLRVLHRRGNDLYINDGIYGTLSDAAFPGRRFPVRRLFHNDHQDSLQDYRLWGPTCDSLDAMAGPWCLPTNMHEGDWIEIGQLGAYGSCLRTCFNGFDQVDQVIVSDEPLLYTKGLDEIEMAQDQEAVI